MRALPLGPCWLLPLGLCWCSPWALAELLPCGPGWDPCRVCLFNTKVNLTCGPRPMERATYVSVHGYIYIIQYMQLCIYIHYMQILQLCKVDNAQSVSYIHMYVHIYVYIYNRGHILHFISHVHNDVAYIMLSTCMYIYIYIRIYTYV